MIPKRIINGEKIRSGMVLITLPGIIRFFGSIEKTKECWLWKRGKDKAGYGKITINKFPVGAHVISYLLYNGAIPDMLHVCHSCDNPQCVNPEHLWLGTHQDNMKDRDKKGRGSTARAKLCMDEAQEIRKCVKLGATHKEMAGRFGVISATINSIIQNKTWKKP